MPVIRPAILACAVLACGTGAAAAADLPARQFAAAPSPLEPVSAFSWEGFYAGAHAGYGKTRDDKVGLFHVGPGGGNMRNVGGNLKPGGAIGGLQAGYNWQHGSVVFGLEADASILSGKASFRGTYGAPINTDVTTEASKNFTASLRSRFGYAFGSTLLYGTGGISVTQVRYQIDPVGGTPMTANNARIAPVIGAGIEHAIGDRWSVRLEGLYSAISLRRLPSAPVPGGQISTAETQGHWMVRAGVNYRFGGPAPQPIAARF